MAVKPRGSDANGDSYEAHLEALDRVIADLEGDALSLEATIDRYKEGVSHLGSCRKILDAAEKRLAELVAAGDGVEERPLEVGPDGLVDAGRVQGTSPRAISSRASNGDGASQGSAARAKAAAPAPARRIESAPPNPIGPHDIGDDLPF